MSGSVSRDVSAASSVRCGSPGKSTHNSCCGKTRLTRFVMKKSCFSQFLFGCRWLAHKPRSETVSLLGSEPVLAHALIAFSLLARSIIIPVFSAPYAFINEPLPFSHSGIAPASGVQCIEPDAVEERHYSLRQGASQGSPCQPLRGRACLTASYCTLAVRIFERVA